MNMKRSAAALLGLVVLASGCDRGVPDGPPVVAWGRDVCDHCGMMISDARSAATAVVLREGKPTVVKFDDPGDLFDHQRDHPEEQTQRAYVTDYGTKQWVELDRAVWVIAADVHTPMGSGLMAFARGEDADAAAERYKGRRLTIAEVRERRAAKPSSDAGCCGKNEGS
jgi:copper chaperone NosL